MPNNNEASLSGQGSDIMLPSRGNPFAGQTDAATPDLSPEDVAAMFKESLPGQAAPPPSPEPEPISFGTMEEAPATFPMPAPTGEASVESAEAPPTAVVTNTTTVMTEMSSTTSGAGTAEASSASTAVVATTTTTVEGDQPGVRAAAAGGVELHVSSAEIGPRTDVYVRSAGLPSDPALVNLLVPEDRVMMLWLDIDSLERDIVSSTGVGLIGRRTAEEFIDRLTAARNLLMNHLDQFEDANREVITVRYRLTRIRKTSFLEDRRVIGFYLLILFVLEIMSFIALDRAASLIANPVTVVGLPLSTLWYIILWGGVGGIFAAAWSLVVRHVDDYDPQYAQWYYLSPLMALVTGPLIAMLAQIALPATMMAVSVGEQSNAAINPIVLYILAFVVGFQQNLLLNLLNYVVERIFHMDTPKDKNKPPAAGK